MMENLESLEIRDAVGRYRQAEEDLAKQESRRYEMLMEDLASKIC